MEKTIDKVIEKYQKYAEENGFSLNPNSKVVETVVQRLLEREKQFGQKYCPCRRMSENKEEDKKIICPCIYHQQEIKEQEQCYCGLFVKNDN